MNSNEFRDWMNYHIAAFPNVGAWFNDKDQVPDPRQTQQHWYNALRFVALDAAKKATDEMSANEDLIPQGRADHARRIKRIAAEIASQEYNERKHQKVDGEEVFSCNLCQDTGFVSVYSTVTMEDAAKGYPLQWPVDSNGKRRPAPDREIPHPIRVRPMGVTCTCDQGEMLAIKRPGPDPFKPPRMYDESCMMLMTRPVEEMTQQRATELLANYNPRPSNYDNRLSEWSQR